MGGVGVGWTVLVSAAVPVGVAPFTTDGDAPAAPQPASASRQDQTSNTHRNARIQRSLPLDQQGNALDRTILLHTTQPTKVDAPDPRFGPATITSNGFTASNPLATTVRFAYPTRGEGQLQLPPLHTLNLRVARRVETKWGWIDPAIDVFNPLNWDHYLQFRAGATQTYNSWFGQGTNRQRARSVQVSVRVGF